MINESRAYGAPGETRRWAIFVDDYRLQDGSISDDIQWLLNQIQVGTHRGSTVISITPLYAGSK